MDIREITPNDPEWAPQLFDMGDDMPERLWVRGEHRLVDVVEEAVAIVGSRACTQYGQHCAEQLASQALFAGASVVSGGAFGIDAAAHRSALSYLTPGATTTTVAVLACGVNKSYPSAHHALFERIAEVGLLVSAYVPGAAPTRNRFLQRNELIVALANDTIVVEAATRSGSMHAAHTAAHMPGRTLGAVPGPITSLQSAGTNSLIKSGKARLVTEYDDLNGETP